MLGLRKNVGFGRTCYEQYIQSFFYKLEQSNQCVRNGRRHFSLLHIWNRKSLGWRSHTQVDEDFANYFSKAKN